MMNELASQVENICQEIEVGRANHEHKVAIEAYIVMLQDCNPLVEEMKRSKDYRAVLNSQLSMVINSTSEVEEHDMHEAVVTCWRELSSAWVEDDYRVKQGEAFSKFSMAVRTYNKALARNNERAFRSWIAERDAEIVVPEAALETQRKVPDLRKVTKRYDSYYEEFKHLTSNLPTVDSARRLLDCIEHIQAIKSEMVFDLPEPVQKFFQSLQSSIGGGGAPLNLLTEEVWNWLEEHGQTDNYVIRRKGQSSW